MEQKVEKQASLESVPVKRLKRELKYQGTILKMYEDTVEVNGHQAKWDFIHHDGAAAVLPVTEDGKILMVRTGPRDLCGCRACRAGDCCASCDLSIGPYCIA